METHFHSQVETASFSPSDRKRRKSLDYSTADKLDSLETTHRLLQQVLFENQFLKNKLAGRHQFVQHIPRALEVDMNSIEAWQASERNRYLQNKLQKLKQQKERQGRHLEQIRQSDKWQKKDQCNPQSCYYKKYMRLLRAKCPSADY